MKLVLLVALTVQGMEYAVLTQGLFHHDEVEAEQGLSWMGLCHRDGQWELKPIEPVILREHDPLLDGEDEATGWRILTPGEKPLILLGGSAGGLPAGPVGTVHDQPVLLSAGMEIPFSDNDGLEVTEEGVFYRLGNERQKVTDVYQNMHGEGVTLLWAGDLDLDGRTDLVFNDRAHYAYWIFLRVFLSTEAGEGELLGEAAELAGVSC